jgi:erythromycin esterase
MRLRIVQFLVEHAGFRTVAFENDFATGLAIDRYVTTGEGDPVALVSEMSSPFWATEEIVDLDRWLRSYNQTHTEPVRFFGADLLQLRQESFDAITAYVARVAPDRLDDLAADLDRLRLRGSPTEHLLWYLSLEAADRQPLIAAARRVSELVDRLHDRTDPTERQYARQHACAMVGWHRYYDDESLLSPVREEFIAGSIEWWQRLTSDTIV